MRAKSNLKVGGDVVLVVGNCSFTEARGRPAAHVFALCDLGRGNHLTPVSLPGHRLVPGVTVSQDGRQLHLNVNVLPPSLRRVHVGLYLPDSHSFKEADYRLRIVFSDNSGRVMHPQLVGTTGMRYALLASVTLTEKGWNAGRLDPPELYADRLALVQFRPVASWWMSST